MDGPKIISAQDRREVESRVVEDAERRAQEGISINFICDSISSQYLAQLRERGQLGVYHGPYDGC